MQQFLSYIPSLPENDLVINNIVVPVFLVKLLILIAGAVVIHIVATRIIMPLLELFIKRTRSNVDDALFQRKFFRRVLHLLPATVISLALPAVLDGDSETYSLISRALSLYYVLIGLAVFDAFLNAVHDIYDQRVESKKVGVTGAIQALKVICLIVAVILAISVLAGKSPIYFISGLGAFTAILMLIFKDPILGLVAGVQLSAMDLVRKGDWLDIPKHGANGSVVDISLTTVKVRNFDMTFTAIPAYELVSSSFKNWRGMTESGGRRIKRAILFSMSSIRFLSENDIERLCRIKLLASYFDERLPEIRNYNSSEFCDADMSICVNGRRLTNIGTFRAYSDAYLRSHPGINKEMNIMVRQLAPTEYGLPLEVYAFTSDVVWAAHERVQSDIFDHLLAIAPEFGLVVYQRDLRN
jgi:miniconductance mechanosensitive channel